MCLVSLARPVAVALTLCLMSLSSAVAHHAAPGASAAGSAAAGGAGKKAAQVQLQADLNNDDEWNKFLQRDGLLVIDVYSEWCGPCLGMVGNLKKIKVELGGDNLHLAVAKSDTIESLKRFRLRSEPTWLFIAAGQLLNVVFGADAPRLARTIEQELQNEELARRGERERPRRAPHELTPPEQEAADLQAMQVAERREREAAARDAAREARREARAARLERHFADLCAALLMPHAQKHLRKVAEALEPYGIAVADKCPLVLGQQGARVLAAEAEEMGSAAATATLVERPALALLLKKLPDKEGDVIELARRALYGEGLDLEEGPQKKYLAQELCADDLPGLYAPKDRHQRAALLDLLFPKMVGAVVEPPVSAEPPHVAMVFGAWQRRAVLAAAGRNAKLLLRYGFFADADVKEPKLLCKTIEQYEERTEKDFCETVVLMVAVGVAEPLLADPDAPVPEGPPPDLITLGPLHVSADTVAGEQECARFFPPGYSQPQERPKVKAKKKKKKRHEVKDEDECRDMAPGAAEDAEVKGEDDGSRETEDGEGEGDGEDDGEGEGEGEEADGEEAEDDTLVVDKATSPPPLI